MMTRLPKNILINILLIALSVVLVLGLALLADRLLGRLSSPSLLECKAELVFPPGSRQCIETHEFSYEVDINELGLRERPVAALDGAFRIAVLGDSFTYGWGVEEEAIWVRRLEGLLRAETGESITTINLGKPGAGPPFYAKLAEEAIPLLKPDLVVVALLLGDDLGAAMGGEAVATEVRARKLIWRFFPNTMRLLADRALAAQKRDQALNSPFDTKAEAMRLFSRKNAQTILETAPEEALARYEKLDPEIRAAFEAGNLNPSLVSVAIGSPNFFVDVETVDSGFAPEAIQKCAGYLTHIREVAERYGARVVTLGIPLGAYVNAHALENYARVGFATKPSLLTCTGPDEAFAIAARQAQLPYLSVSTEFREHQEDPTLYYPMDGHFTAAGHRLFAELAAPKLASYVKEP